MSASGKFLIQMSGPPGSGKSTLSRRLARSIDAVVIDHDLIKAFLLDSNLPFQISSKLTYGLDWTLAEDVILQGRSVIIDNVCNHDEVLDRGMALAEKHGCTYRYVECRVEDIDLLDRRLHERITLRSQRPGVHEPPRDAPFDVTGANVDSVKLFKKWMNPRRPADAAVRITVDSTRSREECLGAVMERLGFPTAERAKDDS